MPELPEVETIKRDLEKKVVGQTINRVLVKDDRVIKGKLKSQFAQKLKGKIILSIDRRGKAIIFAFKQGGFLVVQVKMTGFFELLKSDLNPDKHTKVIFQLSNQEHLFYNDQRIFGNLIFTEDLKEISFLNSIGPEPLNGVFTSDWLHQQLEKRKSPIKTLLMNQTFVAGIGNIYASEILFKAKIDPTKASNRLTQQEIKNLQRTTVDILKQAIHWRGTSMRNYRDTDGKKGSYINRIKVYGRDDQPCPNCLLPILRIVQAGRSTFYCKSCQK